MSEPLLQAQDRLGTDFEIIRPLGSGGMGAVYLARQLSTDAVRAVKVMRSRYADDPTFRRRFEQEARVGSKIHSEHIIDVIAAGIDEQRRLPWLAMEYVEGKTLATVMQRLGVPGQRDAESLLDQLFHAISKAHEARVVHRDIKPDNIFLARSQSPNAQFVVKVLDFGIAKWLSASVGEPTDSLWTMLWGAPEQSMRSTDLGPQADVWSLGLLLFWLFVGEHYWHVERGMRGVLQEILEEPLPVASQRARELGCLRPLSPAFDAWFGRCVARNPAHRFSDAGAAQRVLAEVQLDWPQHAAPWRIEAWEEFEATRSSMPPQGPASGVISSYGTRPSHSSSVLTRPSTHPGHGTFDPLGASARGQRGASAWSPTWQVLAGVGAVALVGAIGVGGWWVGRETSDAAVQKPVAADDATDDDATDERLAPVDPRSRERALANIPEGMKWIAPGRGVFGPWSATPGESTARWANIAGFYLDQNEVDVAHYAACVKQGACSASGLQYGPAPKLTLSGQQTMCNAGQADREKHPINCVSRAQADAYCQWLGKRLPTEAEWEYAARGEEARRYPWGDAAPEGCRWAVVSGLCTRSPSAMRAVGSRLPQASSPFGVTDMAGNVWEWVYDDWMDVPRLEAPHDAAGRRGGAEMGILRGGSWDHPAQRATTTSRKQHAWQTGDVNTGFRCAQTPKLSRSKSQEARSRDE